MASWESIPKNGLRPRAKYPAVGGRTGAHGCSHKPLSEYQHARCSAMRSFQRSSQRRAVTSKFARTELLRLIEHKEIKDYVGHRYRLCSPNTGWIFQRCV